MMSDISPLKEPTTNNKQLITQRNFFKNGDFYYDEIPVSKFGASHHERNDKH